jgi:hypothetical protein
MTADELAGRKAAAIVAIVGVDLRGLVAWLTEPDDVEERRCRAAAAKRAIDQALAGIDRVQANRQMIRAAKLQLARTATPRTLRPSASPWEN